MRQEGTPCCKLSRDLLDLTDPEYHPSYDDAPDEAHRWLDLTGELPALSSLTLAMDSGSFYKGVEEFGGADACLPQILAYLQGATQLTRLDLTAKLGLPLRYMLGCLGQSLGARLRSLTVGGGEVPPEAAAFQLFALAGSFPHLADLTLAVPPAEALVMAMLQELGTLLPHCRSLKTLCLEAGELDTGRAGLERVRSRCRMLGAGGACTVFVV